MDTEKSGLRNVKRWRCVSGFHRVWIQCVFSDRVFLFPYVPRLFSILRFDRLFLPTCEYTCLPSRTTETGLFGNTFDDSFNKNENEGPEKEGRNDNGLEDREFSNRQEGKESPRNTADRGIHRHRSSGPTARRLFSCKLNYLYIRTMFHFYHTLREASNVATRHISPYRLLSDRSGVHSKLPNCIQPFPFEPSIPRVFLYPAPGYYAFYR